MKILLIGSPEGQASFVQSLKAELPYDHQNETLQFKLNDEHSLDVMTMTVDDVEKSENANQILEADAVIYAGAQAMQKNRMECEYLTGFNAACLLKNLHQLLQDHQRPSPRHSFR